MFRRIKTRKRGKKRTISNSQCEAFRTKTDRGELHHLDYEPESIGWVMDWSSSESSCRSSSMSWMTSRSGNMSSHSWVPRNARDTSSLGTEIGCQRSKGFCIVTRIVGKLDSYRLGCSLRNGVVKLLDCPFCLNSLVKSDETNSFR